MDAALPSHAEPQMRRVTSALLTDLYQLTMAYGYWKSGMMDTEAVFHLIFRKNPFRGGFSIACGLSDAINYLKNLRFHDDELDYLAQLTGHDNEPLFDIGFLKYLHELGFESDDDGFPEGIVVLPQMPLQS